MAAAAKEDFTARSRASLAFTCAAFEEVLDAEFIPASAGDLVDEALRLEGEAGDLKVILDGGDDALNRTVTQLADDLGGGEKTKEEIRRIIRTAAANETTRAGRQKSIQQQLYILCQTHSLTFSEAVVQSLKIL